MIKGTAKNTEILIFRINLLMYSMPARHYEDQSEESSYLMFWYSTLWTKQYDQA